MEEYFYNGRFLLGSFLLDKPGFFCRRMGSEHRRRVAEAVGVGIGILFMQKTFDLNWEEISEVEGSSRRPDYRVTSEGREMVFECKGTFNHKTQRTQITSGVEQKNARLLPAVTTARFVISTLISNADLGSSLVVADPPGSDQSESSRYELQVLKHYTRLCKYAGFERIGNQLYSEYKAKLIDLYPKKKELLPGILEKRELRVEGPSNEGMDRITIGENTYQFVKRLVGSGKHSKLSNMLDIDNIMPNSEFIFGIDKDVLSKLVHENYGALKNKKTNVKMKTIENEKGLFLLSSDGGLFGITKKPSTTAQL
jgi:hypothetical protein